MELLTNWIGGREEPATDLIDVYDPALGRPIARAPLSGAEIVDRAAQTAAEAQREWRHVPVGERIQPLFKLKQLLERDRNEIALTVTAECGKTLAESQGELQRAIENVETACGAPTMLQGAVNEDIARGIDELMIRQPVGVAGIIAPFNFPAMIPMWFLPYAVAAGNGVVLKPSEKVPMTMARFGRLFAEAGFPDGLINIVHGARETAEAMLAHPTIRSISFVGSTAAARHVYATAAAHGKRVQCQGGAKNPIVVLEDCDFEMTAKIAADSAFGCAGQRCLASSLAIPVGGAHKPFVEAMSDIARSRRVGRGSDEGVEMGPVITAESRDRIRSLIGKACDEGAMAVVDGRDAQPADYADGWFVGPTVLDGLPAAGDIAKTEIFGPVLGVLKADTVEEAVELINSGAYGNMACLFTSSGRAARQFRHDVDAGNIGINVGVAAPMAYFPFSGWKDSFFGDLHAQGRDAFEFFTQEKVVVERWPETWSRKF